VIESVKNKENIIQNLQEDINLKIIEIEKLKIAETYTLNFADRNARMQAYINSTKECNYWSIFLVTRSEYNLVRLIIIIISIS
jgi:hypothetical protein